jgi:transglutaminase-like putative cysteine protease
MPSEINPRILVFLLSSVGLITLPHIENIPSPIFAFFASMLGWRFLTIWKKNWLPHKIIIFLVTLSGLLLMFSQFRSIWGRDAGTSLFVLALGLKLLEIKSQRDLYLITYLAFVVATSLFLYEQSILMALYILFVCCALLATLVTINSQQPQTLAALKKSAIIIAQALPIAAVLFVLFPRVEAPRWMLFKNETHKKLGLQDSIEPGSITDLGMSPELVFRVKFKGEIPSQDKLYWRGPAYSYTDGKRWTHSGDMVMNPYLDTPSFKGKAYEYTLLMEPQIQQWVFALDLPEKFSANLQQNGTYQLISMEPPNSRAEYQITSYPDYNTGYLTKSEYRDNLQLPDDISAEIKALVTKLHGFDKPPEVFIQSLLQHFKNEDFHYTLKPPLMEEKPIETFLFKTRYGFCSHYATAFVYLMRVANIPARVIGGYQGGEMNKVGQFLEVRQADAHAWAEVWIENKGWIRIDPTAAVAPQRVEQGVNVDRQLANQEVDFSPTNASDVSWLKQIRQMWQTVDYSWQRWIINYDHANQSQFLSALGIHNLRTMLYVMLCIITVITAVLAWFLLKNNRHQVDKVVQVYDKFCQKLTKAQLTRRSSEGAQDFAARACAHLPTYSEQIQAITALYINLRYGKNPSPQLFEQFKQHVNAFTLSKQILKKKLLKILMQNG